MDRETRTPEITMIHAREDGRVQSSLSEFILAERHKEYTELHISRPRKTSFTDTQNIHAIRTPHRASSSTVKVRRTRSRVGFGRGNLVEGLRVTIQGQISMARVGPARLGLSPPRWCHWCSCAFRTAGGRSCSMPACRAPSGSAGTRAAERHIDRDKVARKAHAVARGSDCCCSRQQPIGRGVQTKGHNPGLRTDRQTNSQSGPHPACL